MVLFFYNKQYKNEIFAGYSHLYDPLTGCWPFLAGPERRYGVCVSIYWWRNFCPTQLLAPDGSRDH